MQDSKDYAIKKGVIEEVMKILEENREAFVSNFWAYKVRKEIEKI